VIIKILTRSAYSAKGAPLLGSVCGLRRSINSTIGLSSHDDEVFLHLRP
jgi:hypothetical protein